MVIISDEEIAYNLKRIKAVLRHAEKIINESRIIFMSWYNMYLENRKWYWGSKLSYDKFLNSLSDDCDFKFAANFSGFGSIIVTENNQICKRLRTKFILKYTGIDEEQFKTEKSIVLKSLEFVRKNRSTLYQLSDAVGDLSLSFYKNRYDEKYLVLFDKCTLLIEENDIEIPE